MAAMCTAALWFGIGATALAQGPAAVRKQVESSMLLTGTIDLRADGSVAGHRIDQDDKLTPALREMVAKATATWRFEPVTLDPGATIGRAKMSLRLVAKKLDEENFSVRITGANFGQYVERPARMATRTERKASTMKPPRYPYAALRAGTSATVYVIVKVGHEGRVQDAAAEQTNLRFVASERDMERWRKLFEEAALRAARDWTLAVPADEKTEEPFWSARVPVDFVIGSDPARLPNKPGVWEAYVPGPRSHAPWLRAEAEQGNDALIAGEPHPVGSGPKLLTPLQPQG